jgi:Na+-driven multidrug efflux pump
VLKNSVKMKISMLQQDLTTGNITSKLWMFALPLMLGNVMQQFYNLADTWIVGRYIGSDAMAAVGIKGTAEATTISQYISGVGLMIYYHIYYPS